jgi:FAD/FMN-containing dehydrogenase
VTYSNSLAYNNSLETYFVQQEQDIKPLCIVIPSCTEEVSTALKVLTGTAIGYSGVNACQFAIKSGGHGYWGGDANLENGVVIDLGEINEIEVHADRTVTTVGAGARWGEVYLALDQQNLSVTGGRVSDVGVGGLTLGGQKK